MATEMLFKDLAEQVINGSFGAALKEEREQEIADIGKAWDFYYGEQIKYIKQYRGEKEEDFIDKDKPTFNYTRAIIDEYVRGVFGKPVSITFDDEKQTATWDKIIEPISFFDVVPWYKSVQRIAEISDTCLVMVRHNKKSGLTYFEEIRGEYVSFLPDPDNPRDIGTVIIDYVYDTGDPNPQKKFMRRIEIWDKEKWVIYLHSDSMKQTQILDQGTNPYSFIPGVRFQPLQDDNTFYGISSVKDIVTVNEVYNNLWTSLVRIATFQSFSILVVTTDGTMDVVVAPTRFIKFEKAREGTKSSDAKYITPSAKIAEVEKVLHTLKAELQNFSHVPEEVLSSAGSQGAPQSGYALRIKRIPIENAWQERRESYGPSLKKMVKMAIVIDQLNGREITPQEAPSYMEAVQPSIIFTDTQPGLAPQEQIIKDQHELQYGVISPIDLVLRKHPEMSREDAKQHIINNRKEAEELGISMMESKEDADEGYENLNRRLSVVEGGAGRGGEE